MLFEAYSFCNIYDNPPARGSARHYLDILTKTLRGRFFP